jgi:hypothetical protein
MSVCINLFIFTILYSHYFYTDASEYVYVSFNYYSASLSYESPPLKINVYLLQVMLTKVIRPRSAFEITSLCLLLFFVLAFRRQCIIRQANTAQRKRIGLF